MIVAVDVHYHDDAVVAARVELADWRDAAPVHEAIATHTGTPAPYEPGAFYKRELPYLRGIVDGVGASAIVIDGYAWLDVGRPGLGVHLYDATGVPVIGVAKRRFSTARPIEVVRGASKVPLYVTAIGCEADQAAADVRAMHGPYRMPTVLTRVDQLCRRLVRPVAGRRTG